MTLEEFFNQMQKAVEINLRNVDLAFSIGLSGSFVYLRCEATIKVSNTTFSTAVSSRSFLPDDVDFSDPVAAGREMREALLQSLVAKAFRRHDDPK